MTKKTLTNKKAEELGYITIPESARRLGISPQGMQKKLKIIPLPSYFKKIGNKYFVDPEDIVFFGLLESREEEAFESVKHELKKIKIKSVEASFYLPIQKYELNKYKLEQERLALEKESKHLINFDLAEYLFFGYMERSNREVLNFPNRIKREMDMVIQGGLHAGHDSHKICEKIIKIIFRELEAILKDIIKEQKKDVEAWQEE